MIYTRWPNFPEYAWSFPEGNVKLKPPDSWEDVSPKQFFAMYTAYFDWMDGQVHTHPVLVHISMNRKTLKKKMHDLLQSEKLRAMKKGELNELGQDDPSDTGGSPDLIEEA